CVSWNTGDSNVATVNVAGLATAHGGTQTTVSATFYGVTGTTNLYVRPSALTSIAVTPQNPSVAAGLVLQFTATATFADNSTENVTTKVFWKSENTGASAINTTGLAIGVAQGGSVISATAGGVSDQTTLTVTPPVLQSISISPKTPTLNKGQQATFTTTAQYSVGTYPKEFV